MLYAAIDIHKHAFQAAVLDPESGEVVEERFSAERERLVRWARSGGGPGQRCRDRRDNRLAVGLAAPLRPRRRALPEALSIYGIGPILACHLLAEIGEARRFRRAGSDHPAGRARPGRRRAGETRRRGMLDKAGSPHLRWALVEAAVHAHRTTAPDLELYRTIRQRRDATVARLTVARTIGSRVFHALRELEPAA